ncbi:MAG: hypothetical protein P8M11_13520 [Planctomycetota bacterium]|nr:hypothetical protein [Planctomycetota bacterium]
MNSDHAHPHDAAAVGFRSGSVVAGEVRVPGSKSVAQRLLAAAAVARGRTELLDLPASEDVAGAVRCARALGARFPSAARADDPLAAGLFLSGGGGPMVGAAPTPEEGPRPWARLDPGESGTSARLFTALAALARPAGSGAEVVPSGTLTGRSSRPLLEALGGAGAGVEHAGHPHGWPVLFTSVSPPAWLELRHPVSSQEVSGLLLALSAHAGERRLRVLGPIPSRGYVEVTRQVIEVFGGAVRSEALLSDAPEEAGLLFTVRGPLAGPKAPVRCERDASAAAVALAAGVVSGGHRVQVEGVGAASLQPDVAIVACLQAFGCSGAGTTDSRLVVSGAPSRGVNLDCGGFPDLAPVLAAVAAHVAIGGRGPSTLTGLGTLPGKESDRLAVLARGLRAIGLSVQQGPASLEISAVTGTRSREVEVLLDSSGDHRMVFFGALLSLFEPRVRVLDPGCVGKSWPGFWADLAAAGGTLSTS